MERVAFQMRVEDSGRAAFERRYGTILEQRGERLVPAPERNQYTVVAYSAPTRTKTSRVHINAEAEPIRQRGPEPGDQRRRSRGHAGRRPARPQRGQWLPRLLPIYRGGIVPQRCQRPPRPGQGFAVGIFRSLSVRAPGTGRGGPSRQDLTITENRHEVLSIGDIDGIAGLPHGPGRQPALDRNHGGAAPSLLIPALHRGRRHPAGDLHGADPGDAAQLRADRQAPRRSPRRRARPRPARAGGERAPLPPARRELQRLRRPPHRRRSLRLRLSRLAVDGRLRAGGADRPPQLGVHPPRGRAPGCARSMAASLAAPTSAASRPASSARTAATCGSSRASAASAIRARGRSSKPTSLTATSPSASAWRGSCASSPTTTR